jgi:hypothetical protein
MEKEKIYISAGDFELSNGGILQVNLQRLTSSFDDFISSLDSRTFCDLVTINSAYSSMSDVNRQIVTNAATYGVGTNAISTVLDNL